MKFPLVLRRTHEAEKAALRAETDTLKKELDTAKTVASNTRLEYGALLLQKRKLDAEVKATKEKLSNAVRQMAYAYSDALPHHVLPLPAMPSIELIEPGQDPRFFLDRLKRFYFSIPSMNYAFTIDPEQYESIELPYLAETIAAKFSKSVEKKLYEQALALLNANLTTNKE